MSVLGSASNWVDLLERILPEILRLVVDAWRALPTPLANDKEDEITMILCRALRKTRTVRELPLLVDTQMVELDPAVGQDLGRVDVAFRPTGLSGPPNESIYFCLECKRLNVVNNGQTRAYASEYVRYGIIRFVSGQYARAVRHGGMIGYVLDGRVGAALKNVEANVQTRYAELRMDPPGKMHASSILTDEAYARETFHRRAHDAVLFRIHHVFIAN